MSSDADWRPLVEMLERVAAALHDEARDGHRMSRRGVGAAAGTLELLAKQGRELLHPELAGVPPSS